MPLDLTPKQPPYYTVDDTPIQNQILEGREYIVYLNQTGTNAPTAGIVKDNIGSIVPARTTNGSYTFTKAGAFPLGNTTWHLQTNLTPQIEGSMMAIWQSEDAIGVFTFNNAGVATDGLLTNVPFYIRIIE